MNKIFQKFISSILIFSIVFLNLSSVAWAEDVNTNTGNTEQTETASEQPTPTTDPENNTDSETPSEVVPTAVPTPVVPTPTKIVEQGDPNRLHSATSAFVLGVNPIPTPTPQATSHNIGDTSLKTGDMTNTAGVTNTGNTNLSASDASAYIGGIDTNQPGIVNSGNANNSTNSGSANIANTGNTTQTNSAIVNTDLAQSSTTGSNSASYNVGGNTDITTGNANVTGTVITSVNTNVEGVMVSEFNIVDDHIGDILLDFNANCISGCGNPLNAVNAGNGSNSDNTASLTETNVDDTVQINDAVIGSNLNLSADSGNNTSSYNVGGDSNITTGDANVEANVLTFANNNIAGDVVYAVVNIFGDLLGDILFPEEFMANCCGVSSKASNTGNGPDSVNNTNVNIDNSENTFQANDANIVNELIFDATTGENATNRNTGGDSSITTGNTSVDANVLNVANSNIADGNMWLVLINEAGNWIGKILGSSDNSNFAGSEGTEFTVDENGFITASNAGNGENTDNVSDIVLNNTDNTTQNNTADIHNTLNLSANTGGNQASNNTGGDSNIKTGDAKIVANLINFVNNNIKGNGKLFVTVVNVFGSWFGDFVSPGQTQQSKTDSSEQNTGGPNASTNSSSQIANTKVSATSNTASTDNNGATTVIVTPKAKTTFFAFSNPVNSEKGKNTQKALVKGVSANSINTLGVSDNDGKIKINLAWLAFILPLAIFGFSFKKLILPKINRKI